MDFVAMQLSQAAMNYIILKCPPIILTNTFKFKYNHILWRGFCQWYGVNLYSIVFPTGKVKIGKQSAKLSPTVDN